MMGKADALFRYVRKQIEISVEEKCVELTERLCLLGLAYRESNRHAHNFTGNLINSIVAALYRDGVLVSAEYASHTVGKSAITVKMTAPKTYHFKRDWEGKKSEYDAEVPTDKGWGASDAERFVKEYRPKGKGWVITLAYPVEYAAFVENERSSTGIAQVESEMSAQTGNIAKWFVNDVQLPMGEFSSWDHVRADDLTFKAVFADRVNNSAKWTITSASDA